jgi:hypothetical protein
MKASGKAAGQEREPVRLMDRPELVPKMERELLGVAREVRCMHCEEVMPVGMLWLVPGRSGDWYVCCADYPECEGSGPAIDLWPVKG